MGEYVTKFCATTSLLFPALKKKKKKKTPFISLACVFTPRNFSFVVLLQSLLWFEHCTLSVSSVRDDAFAINIVWTFRSCHLLKHTVFTALTALPHVVFLKAIVVLQYCWPSLVESKCLSPLSLFFPFFFFFYVLFDVGTYFFFWAHFWNAKLGGIFVLNQRMHKRMLSRWDLSLFMAHRHVYACMINANCVFTPPAQI